jgi:hypothetical protein
MSYVAQAWKDMYQLYFSSGCLILQGIIPFLVYTLWVIALLPPCSTGPFVQLPFRHKNMGTIFFLEIGHIRFQDITCFIFDLRNLNLQMFLKIYYRKCWETGLSFLRCFFTKLNKNFWNQHKFLWFFDSLYDLY